ncbi:hypothetical protein ACFLTW_04180 [Chloroflexota bacterium]
MAEELGKIKKPEANSFKKGRRLYFIPMVFSSPEAAEEYQALCTRYWRQVDEQLDDLEKRLGQATHLYHELIPQGGPEGLDACQKLSEASYKILAPRAEKGAKLEAFEEPSLLTEFIDWTKCLSVGLQNAKVISTVYEAYQKAHQSRNEHMVKQIDATLLPEETGVMLIREGHHLQFPPDIEVFYVSPPALDEIKRWLRARQEESPAQ